MQPSRTRSAPCCMTTPRCRPTPHCPNISSTPTSTPAQTATGTCTATYRCIQTARSAPISTASTRFPKAGGAARPLLRLTLTLTTSTRQRKPPTRPKATIRSASSRPPNLTTVSARSDSLSQVREEEPHKYSSRPTNTKEILRAPTSTWSQPTKTSPGRQNTNG